MTDEENMQNYTFEVSTKEVYNDIFYVITLRGYTDSFEIIVEDESDCFIWQKCFSKDYIGKQCERVKSDIDLQALMDYLKEVFEKNEVKSCVDLMHGDTAKSQLEKNKSGVIKKGTLIEGSTTPLNEVKTDENKTDEIAINKTQNTNQILSNQIPPAGERIIFILQYKLNNQKLVLPFPLKYNKNPSPNLFRSIIISLRSQLRNIERSDTTGFHLNRPSISEEGLENKENLMNEIGQRKLTKKVQSEKVDSDKGDEDQNPKKVDSLFQTSNIEASTQNSLNENIIVLNELKEENKGMKSQINQLKDVNIKLKKLSGAVELDNIISEKAHQENKVDVLKRRCEELEMHVKCANELRAEIDRKDRELSIVKEQLRGMPKPKTDTTSNNNYYNNRNSAKANMFMKKDQVPSRPGLANRAQNDKFNIFPKMQSNVAPSAKVYGNANNYQQAKNRYSAAGNNRANLPTRQNLNSRGTAQQQRLPTWANSNSRNRLGYPTNVSSSMKSQRNSSNNLMKNNSEKRFIGNGIKTSQVSNTESKRGLSTKNLGYPTSKNRVLNERSMSNPKMPNQDPSAQRQGSSVRNGAPGYRNNSNGPRINYNGKSGNLSLSHSRSIENNRNRYMQPKFNSKTPMGYT